MVEYKNENWVKKWWNIRTKIGQKNGRIKERKLDKKMVKYKNKNWVRKWWNIRTKIGLKSGGI